MTDRMNPSTPLEETLGMEMFEGKLSEARDGAMGLSLAAFRMDHATTIQRTLGYNSYQNLLKMLGQRLATCVAQDEILFETKDDLFLLLLPDRVGDEARFRAERFREAVSEDSFSMDPTLLLDVTVSGGLTTVNPGDCEPQDVLRTTLHALEEAVANGRNRICEKP